MKIGSLYLVKRWFWLLFPTKETAYFVESPLHRWSAALDPDPAFAYADVAYWSQKLNCELTCFSPDTHVVFLAEEGKYKQVLTSDGKIGWTVSVDNENDCFEEVNAD